MYSNKITIVAGSGNCKLTYSTDDKPQLLIIRYTDDLDCDPDFSDYEDELVATWKEIRIEIPTREFALQLLERSRKELGHVFWLTSDVAMMYKNWQMDENFRDTMSSILAFNFE
jgi:hypothetical protein